MDRLILKHEIRMLTRKELEETLGVTPMTVYLWRKLEDPIPCRTVVKGERHRIFFPVAQVHDWLKKYRPNLAPKIGGLNGGSSNHGVGSPRADVRSAEGRAA